MPGPTLETKSEYPGHDVRRHVYIFNIYQLILTFFPQPHLLPELKTKKLRDNRGSRIWSSVFPHPVTPGAALNTPVSSGPSRGMETSGFHVPHFRASDPPWQGSPSQRAFSPLSFTVLVLQTLPLLVSHSHLKMFIKPLVFRLCNWCSCFRSHSNHS